MSDATVLSDIVCRLGEGPGFDPDREVLVWFDILGRRLLERRIDQAGTSVHDIGVNGSVFARADGGRQLIVSDKGLHLRDPVTERMSVLLSLEADDDSRRSNDGRVHPCGALWFSTMRRTFDKGEATIWWYFRGELKPIVTGLSIPNGIAFGADGTYAYYACSTAGKVWRIATDPATGLPTGDAAVFATVPESEGVPDGAVVDADGIYWCARWGYGAVVAYGPDGAVVRKLDVPATQSSCPAFVGPGGARMAVTTAREGLTGPALAADPLAGLTFVFGGPFSGRFDPPVRLA